MEINTKTKKISGYLCYMAIVETRKKSKIVACYSPEISISLGPKSFFGLPGLILELDDGNFTFTARKIEINPIRQIEINKPKEGKEVSAKEFKELIKKNSPFKN